MLSLRHSTTIIVLWSYKLLTPAYKASKLLLGQPHVEVVFTKQSASGFVWLPLADYFIYFIHSTLGS